MTEKWEKEIHQLRIKQLHKISNSKKGVVHVIYNFKTNILFKQTNYHGKRVQQFLRDNLTNALFCVFIYFQLVLVINEAVHSIAQTGSCYPYRDDSKGAGLFNTTFEWRQQYFSAFESKKQLCYQPAAIFVAVWKKPRYKIAIMDPISHVFRSILS